MKKFLPISQKLDVNSKKGFTLVELLVVISIIAILSIIGLTLFTGVQKGVRDARKKSDMDAISKALEAQYSAGRYPTTLISDYFTNGIPTSPDATAYTTTNLTTSAYTVCAQLETSTGNADSNKAYLEKGPYYCRKNQQ